ncbi:hypothetical protein FOA52_011096 [Chlamydomonas sp. UWO 241]|nr:hypothetical protein FOA52_011096 [Chlamydomonas sp. UWO 241]
MPPVDQQYRAEGLQQTLRSLGSSNNWLGSVARALKAAAAAAVQLVSWVWSCGQVLPQFVWPTPREALWRTGLVLSVSLVLIVVVSTIDGGLLQMYVTKSRRFW